MRTFTIGFTQKRAEDFFGLLRKANVKALLDVRLNNVSQLSGFAKRDDLRFFLQELCNAEYRHLTILAPTQEMLDQYKKMKGDWADYERRFLDLMCQRRVEDHLSREAFSDACLLCSEPTPDYCHRRLVAEYLSGRWGDMEIVHLV